MTLLIRFKPQLLVLDVFELLPRSVIAPPLELILLLPFIQMPSVNVVSLVPVA